ncbi:MAG: DUF1028 domain-containing protein [Bacteroidales bacterium]|nr:DUF1028 domain-containing protein [Bacteroidales bacterium]MCF8344754.1 DUF1028 domain-containing protein [Bacteroidales bacterium]MCF8352596.1 DUF1028 domain-containing protein [Bacteroidales bacterium]MCF8377335.1 DUF1028 domain-containing protein [Bacteroidales bacterium]MCF8401919.1 DUF1028 domain-containing protein [Bacteroidales bacterium]
MKKFYLAFLFTSLLLANTFSQDTFSIIALDTLTGEIGGAGASCIDGNDISGGVLIINDILPGRGGIHTQAWWRPQNQQNAHDKMEEGLSPHEIIDWLVENDAQGRPDLRQYGIVDFDSLGNPRSAAFTGENCDDYKNHIIGPNYAIQGNILLGQEILDSMEYRFLNTEGMLAEKLMAALQGANVPGADTRCSGEGVSSQSAFVRVAITSDTTGEFFCDLLVEITPYGVEPIDSLQMLFDNWMTSLSTGEYKGYEGLIEIAPNPVSQGEDIRLTFRDADLKSLVLIDRNGKKLVEKECTGRHARIETSLLMSGLYILMVYDERGWSSNKKLIIL